MREAKRIGIISDTHCGSRYGLLAPDSEFGRQNPLQEYLWQCWTDSLAWLGKLDLLVLLGDAIDGQQRKTRGDRLITTNFYEQAKIFGACLRVQKDQPTKIIRVCGTIYHEGTDNPLAPIDRDFGILYQGVSARIEAAPGIVMNFAHHPESRSAEYDGMVMEKEARNMALGEYHYGAPPTAYLIRGHKHKYRRAVFHKKWVVICPCFQGQTKYAQLNGLLKWVPEFGVVLLERDEKEEHGYSVRGHTFSVPSTETEVQTYESLNWSRFNSQSRSAKTNTKKKQSKKTKSGKAKSRRAGKAVHAKRGSGSKAR
jgi:hypothetical protein